jgi:hypothetical protein
MGPECQGNPQDHEIKGPAWQDARPRGKPYSMTTHEKRGILIIQVLVKATVTAHLDSGH